MDMLIPAIFESLSVAGSDVKEFLGWRKKAKGDARSLIDELKDNMTYLKMVARNEIDLGAVIDKISISEYKRLSKEGFGFNTLKGKKIAKYSSLQGTDLSSWTGKKTEDLVMSIYEKINDLKIRYPLVSKRKNYRWNVRVNNIRKRIWLLLIHVRS